MGKQTFVIRLDEHLARRLGQFLGSGVHGYASLDEFIQVALQNQLGVERSGPEAAQNASTDANDGRGLSPLLRPLSGEPPSNLAIQGDSSSDTLFVLTNRLGPIKVAARVLANLAADGHWPSLEEFHEKASRVGREVGLRLREEDLVSEKRGSTRRWIAFPVGEDERAAYNRFVASFTMQTTDDRIFGPMIVLGLGSVQGGRAVLTEAGWRLALAPSPLLKDGVSGLTLSEEEAAILRRQVIRAPGELSAVREFLEIVRRGAGSQRRIDELLAARYPDWTETLTVAHRSALLGRLSDLGVLEVTGRGPSAKTRLLPLADEFLKPTNQEGVA